jgi:hypothetical protein
MAQGRLGLFGRFVAGIALSFNRAYSAGMSGAKSEDLALLNGEAMPATEHKKPPPANRRGYSL